MRVMVIIKETPGPESSEVPPEKVQYRLAEMGRYNEELVKAGILLSAEGLHSSSKGKRIVYRRGQQTVVDGPFAEAKELVAGYWIWKVDSMDEAVAWARRCPAAMHGEEGVLELRPLHELDDFGDEMTPELRAQEERRRAEVERQQRS